MLLLLSCNAFGDLPKLFEKLETVVFLACSEFDIDAIVVVEPILDLRFFVQFGLVDGKDDILEASRGKVVVFEDRRVTNERVDWWFTIGVALDDFINDSFVVTFYI